MEQSDGYWRWPPSLQVLCVKRTDRSGAHERISSIGGLNGDGTRWSLSESEAIRAIEEGRYSFYMQRQPWGLWTTLMIATRLGHKYLKTEADCERPDNLLALPECPPGTV